MTTAKRRRVGFLLMGPLAFSGAIQLGAAVADDIPRLGAEVVLKTPETPLRADGADVPTGWDYRRFRVGKVESPWLWVVSGRLRGWIHQDQVLSPEQAVAAYTKVLENDPQATWVYLWRARARLEHKEYQAALADLDEAIRRNPRDASALILRGTARTEQKQFDQALIDLDQAARISPSDPQVYLRRALVWQAKDQAEKADADLTRALEIDPENSEAHLVRGVVSRDQGESEQSLSELNEAIRLDPRNASAFLERGMTRQQRREYDWALADYQEAVRLDNTLWLALVARGDARFGLGDFTGAAADYALGLRHAPDDVKVLNNLAWFLATCPDVNHRDGRRAVALATKACEISQWKDPNHIDTLAAALAEDGQFEEADRRAEEALKLFRKDSSDYEESKKRQELYKQNKPFRADI